jgi:hypothetical protein
LTIPLGDASDAAIIDAGRAEAGKPDALTAIAERNGGGDEAIVALATARRQGDQLVALDLSVRRYRSGRLADTRAATLDARQGESEHDLFKRAADTAADLVGGLKKSPGMRSDQQATLSASVPINSLDQWVQVRSRLLSVPEIRKVDLLSLNRHEAKVQIRYVGSANQLKSSLVGVDLWVDGTDQAWRLQLSGGARLQ